MKTMSVPNDLTIISKLAQANTVIDKFISSCSHSMRGPIKTIRGLVNLISEEDRSEKKNSERMLELIQKTADQMEHVLIELEEFLENSKNELKVGRVDVNQIIGELRERFRSELAERSIEVSYQITEDATLVTDKDRLTTILTHILSNAISYSDPTKAKRKIVIEIRVFNSSYEISVKDNGIGIAPECLNKIFQLFYRGTERSNGAGIGLYVVKEVIEKMRGLISVQSQPNTGSNFLVWLPNLN